MEHHSLRHYKDEHYTAIKDSNTYEELLTIAMDILSNMPRPIVMVCGPISTGGAGNITENLKNYELTIKKLADDGHHVFNQMPFEKSIQTLRKKYGSDAREQNQIILDKFYLAIYSSGLISKMFFMHGWESSHGAKWERSIAQEKKIEIIDLPKEFLD
jgi:hypothetical protein